MALPATIAVSFDFSSGATFGYPFTIGDAKYGVIGVSQFAATEVPEPVVDLSPNVTNISIRRGRNIIRDTYEAGSCTVRVLDPDGAWNPQNVSSPYYGYLTPLRKLRVSATTATAQEFLFSGYTTEYRYTYPVGQEIGYVDIICADAFRLFNLAGVEAVADSGAGQTTGTRIGKILDQMQFPSNMRQLDTGDTTCQADPSTVRTGLDALKNVEFSEQGALYINSEGTVQFKSRSNVIAASAGTQIEFNQTTGIPYKNLVYAFDDKLIVNSSDITIVGGTTQSAYDQTSIDRYFPHQSNQSNLVAATDADALNIAKIYVATRKDTTIRIDAMMVDLLDAGVPTDTMIGIDYFSVLKISNVQPEGSVITKVLQCQGLAWDITPNKMQVTLTTLEPIIEGFVIGSDVSGIIGVSMMAY